MGREVARADRRVPPAVRSRRAAVEHLERVEGAADAGAEPAAVAARVAAAQRERRRLAGPRRRARLLARLRARAHARPAARSLAQVSCDIYYSVGVLQYPVTSTFR